MATINSINNKSQELTVDPGTSGDSFVQFDINGTGEFRIGIDDDASDAFKISQGSVLGTNDVFIMSESGELRMPLQPAFQVQNNADQTGGSGTYTLTFPNETFDQNNDFDGTSTFTAPVTGRYLLGYVIFLQNVAASMTDANIIINTSNGPYYTMQQNFASGIYVVSSGIYCHVGSTFADMDAFDTATISLNFGSNVAIKGASVVSRRCPVFYGYLVC